MSLKYLVAFTFSEMFEEGYDTTVRDNILKSDITRITNVNVPGFDAGKIFDKLKLKMMSEKLKGNSFNNFRGNF